MEFSRGINWDWFENDKYVFHVEKLDEDDSGRFESDDEASAHVDALITEFFNEYYERGRAVGGADHAVRDAAYERIDAWAEARAEIIGGPIPERIHMPSLSPAQAAFWIWRLCVKSSGLSSTWETLVLSPEKNLKNFGHSRGGETWFVSFEAGPYEWAVDFSNSHRYRFENGTLFTGMLKADFYVAPYYSFDLIFYGKI